MKRIKPAPLALARQMAILVLMGLCAASGMITPDPKVQAAGPWYVTPTGNDGSDCMSPSTACATINAAIGKAVGGDTIRVAVGTYTGAGQEVVLIDRTLVVSGGWGMSFTTQNGASVVDGQFSRRGMAVSRATVTVERFVVQNGAVSFGMGGGGILNDADLTLNKSTIRGNTQGGIRNMGRLTVNESTVSGNSNNSGAGGIENFMFSALTMNNSTVSGNRTTSEGGGINNAGSLALNNSTVSANVADFRGGGIANRIQSTVRLSSTIVAGNTGPFGPDCWHDFGAPIISAGNNLIGNTVFCDYAPGTGDLVPHPAVWTPD